MCGVLCCNSMFLPFVVGEVGVASSAMASGTGAPAAPVMSRAEAERKIAADKEQAGKLAAELKKCSSGAQKMVSL